MNETQRGGSKWCDAGVWEAAAEIWTETGSRENPDVQVKTVEIL